MVPILKRIHRKLMMCLFFYSPFLIPYFFLFTTSFPDSPSLHYFYTTVFFISFVQTTSISCSFFDFYIAIVLFYIAFDLQSDLFSSVPSLLPVLNSICSLHSLPSLTYLLTLLSIHIATSILFLTQLISYFLIICFFS